MPPKNNIFKFSAILIGILIVGGIAFAVLYKNPVASITDQETSLPAVSPINSAPSYVSEQVDPCYKNIEGTIFFNVTYYGVSQLKPVKDADVESFESLKERINIWDTCYGKDKNHVYRQSELFVVRLPYYKKLFPDPETFSVLNSTFAKDKNHVYYLAFDEGGGPQILENADPVTFEVLLERGPYAKDFSRIFYFGLEVEEADPATFIVLNSNFAKDAKNVFFFESCLEYMSCLKIFPGADVSTFTILTDDLAKDKNHIYFFDPLEGGSESRGAVVVLETEDSSIFKSLGGNYLKNNDSVFYGIKKIPEADLATFTFARSGVSDAHDRNYFYARGQIVNPSSSPATPTGLTQ